MKNDSYTQEQFCEFLELQETKRNCSKYLKYELPTRYEFEEYLRNSYPPKHIRMSKKHWLENYHIYSYVEELGI